MRSGLEIVAAMDGLNGRLQAAYPIQLAVRIGIHTGLAVVGEMGGRGRHENLALGEPPNIAARLEELAGSDDVVISAPTQRLVGGAFDLVDTGRHTLRGVTEPMSVYQVLGERPVKSRFEAAATTRLTRLVGRREEVELILRRWQQAKASQGQVVLLCGEAGIGKSRLLQTIGAHLAGDPHICLRYQCSPYHLNSAFYPILSQIEQAARFTQRDTPSEKLDKLEALLAQSTGQIAAVTPLFAALLAITPEDRYPPVTLSPAQQKDAILNALEAQLTGLAAHQPVVIMFEDAHWSDPTSLDVLGRTVHQVRDERVLILITYRPEFESPWRGLPHVTTLTLDRLSRSEGQMMVERVTDEKPLPAEVLDQILFKADGIPLYLEEITKTILGSGLLSEHDDHYTLTGPLPVLAIPSTLYDSLMVRLDQLKASREVAQLGAILGREFSYEMLEALSPLAAPALQASLAQLVEAELLYPRGSLPHATYLFKHALIQDAAYQSMLRSTRQQYHQQVVEMLSEQFAEMAASQPELLAHHATEAGLTELAVRYWWQAGEQAVQRSAYVESIHHFTTSLRLFKTLPEGPESVDDELQLQVALGRSLMIAKGYANPEAGAAYNRARALCQHPGKHRQVFSVLRGLVTFYYMRGAHQTAWELGEQCLDIAQETQERSHLMRAHLALSLPLFYLGEGERVRYHLEQCLSFCDPAVSGLGSSRAVQDSRVTCLCLLSQTLTLLGYADQAWNRLEEAEALAKELSHPFSLTEVMNYKTIYHLSRDTAATARTYAERTMTLAATHDFPHHLCNARTFRGWALAMEGQADEGLTELCQGLSTWRGMGAEVSRTAYLTFLAEAYGAGGAPATGLASLAEALELVAQHGEYLWEGEIYRIQGELLLQQSSESQGKAEACFRQSLNVTRQRHFKTFELRAATSLARLWQSQGKKAEAHELLASVYNWFTEGFDTADLIDAKALLDELA